MAIIRLQFQFRAARNHSIWRYINRETLEVITNHEWRVEETGLQNYIINKEFRQGDKRTEMYVRNKCTNNSTNKYKNYSNPDLLSFPKSNDEGVEKVLSHLLRLTHMETPKYTIHRNVSREKEI